MQAQIREMNAHLEGLEKERDFYFAKVSTVHSIRIRVVSFVVWA